MKGLRVGTQKSRGNPTSRRLIFIVHHDFVMHCFIKNRWRACLLQPTRSRQDFKSSCFIAFLASWCMHNACDLNLTWLILIPQGVISNIRSKRSLKVVYKWQIWSIDDLSNLTSQRIFLKTEIKKRVKRRCVIRGLRIVTSCWQNGLFPRCFTTL